MTASPLPSHRPSFTTPVINYEPPLTGPPTRCPTPAPAALHRHAPRPLRPVVDPPVADPAPPRAAAVFADAALRRVLEVIDRRRPLAQLRPLLSPMLIDTIVALPRSRTTAAATLRRVRLRPSGSDASAAEVFATYTRGDRVRALAARVELVAGTERWQITALQIG